MQTSHTPAHRRQSHITLDTPTPAPSTGHTSVLITSLKPARSRSSLSGDYRNSRTSNPKLPFAAGGGLAPAAAAPSAHLRPLAHSLGRQLNIPEINTEDLNLDHLEIATDGTERKRRTLEDEIRRGMGELGDHSSESESASERESVGRFGDLDDRDDEGRRAAALGDESQSGSESLGDDFSLRINMAGLRGAATAAMGAHHHPDHHASSASDSDDGGLGDLEEADLTYVTLPAHAYGSPAPAPPSRQNNKAPAAAAPPPPAAAPLAFTRPQPTTRDVPRPSFSPAVPSNQRANAAVFADQNRPPGGPSPAFSRPTFANFHPTSVPRNYFTSSPLSPPTLRAPNNSRQTPSDATRMRLPDVTGITDGLRSPLKSRGHYTVAPGATATDEAVINGALGQLKDRLAKLERENSMSAARVRELETRLRDEEHEAAMREPVAARDAGDDWEAKLREEQDRRQGLEDLVTRLRSQVANLAHSLKSQAESINDLRAHRPATPVPSHALEDEVASLRTGLDGLGAEVEAVRSVVDELVREREAQAASDWEREEDERRRSMERARAPEPEGLARREHDRSRRSPAPSLNEGGFRRSKRDESVLEDPDRTPRANRTHGVGRRTGPGTPQTEKSFHSLEEIEALRQSILAEAARSSSPRPHKQHNTAPQEEHESYDAARQSAAAYSKPKESRQHKAPSHHHDDDYRTDQESQLDERAERIFESVRNMNSSADLCTVCRRRRRSGVPDRAFGSAPPKMQRAQRSEQEYEAESEEGNAWDAPPAFVPQQKSRKERQATADSTLKILEDDFKAHMRIFVELAAEYRGMSPRADGEKRRVLGEHLRESMDTLDLKAQRIRDTHDLIQCA
ncbi:hypothetical protein RQP46_009412 [Phenoliferia psychrophenolica]